MSIQLPKVIRQWLKKKDEQKLAKAFQAADPVSFNTLLIKGASRNSITSEMIVSAAAAGQTEVLNGLAKKEPRKIGIALRDSFTMSNGTEEAREKLLTAGNSQGPEAFRDILWDQAALHKDPSFLNWVVGKNPGIGDVRIVNGWHAGIRFAACQALSDNVRIMGNYALTTVQKKKDAVLLGKLFGYVAANVLDREPLYELAGKAHQKALTFGQATP